MLVLRILGRLLLILHVERFLLLLHFDLFLDVHSAHWSADEPVLRLEDPPLDAVLVEDVGTLWEDFNVLVLFEVYAADWAALRMRVLFFVVKKALDLGEKYNSVLLSVFRVTITIDVKDKT